MQERPRNKWPGPRSDDEQTVNEMLNDPNCHHWSECHQFFERLVKLSRVPVDIHDDVVQNALLSVINYLPTFRFDCKFSTWLVYILRSRIVDAMRDLVRANKQVLIPGELLDDDGNDTVILAFQDLHTPEELCISHEELDEVVSAMREYLSNHTNRERNRQILQKFFLYQYTVAEIARELGVNIPVVRSVISAFKRYLNKSNGQSPPSDTID
jgi:RNA polymerase sigma factor (sigma-70 family)